MFAYYMFSHMGTNIQDTFQSCLEIKTTSYFRRMKRANTCISEKIRQTNFLLSLLFFDSWALFLAERDSIYYIILYYIIHRINH